MKANKILVGLILIPLLLFPAIAAAQYKSWDDNMGRARTAWDEGRLDEAQKWYEAALKDAEKYGERNLRLLKSLSSVANIYMELKDFPRAETTYLRAIPIAEKQMKQKAGVRDSERIDRTMEDISAGSGPKFIDPTSGGFVYAQDTLIYDLRALAECYVAQQKVSDAEKTYIRVIEAIKFAMSNPVDYWRSKVEVREIDPKTNKEKVTEISGEENARRMKRRELAGVYDDFATFYLRQRRFDDAEQMYQQSLQLRNESPTSSDLETGLTLEHLGIAYASRGQYDKAEPVFKRALSIFLKEWGPDSVCLAPVLENYAVLLRKLKRDGEASEMMARAATIRQTSKGQASCVPGRAWERRLRS